MNNLLIEQFSIVIPLPPFLHFRSLLILLLHLTINELKTLMVMMSMAKMMMLLMMVVVGKMAMMMVMMLLMMLMMMVGV